MSSTTTQFELVYGSNKSDTERRYFMYPNLNDAVTRFAQKVTEFDGDAEVYAAHVAINRLPDNYYPEGIGIQGWTKTSDERSTFEGTLAPQ